MSTTRSTAWAATLVLGPVLALAGCGSEGGDTGYGSADTTKPSDSGAVGSDVGSQLGGLVNQAKSDLAENYAEQVKQQQSEMETIKATAKGYGDQQLDTAIQQIEKVLDQLAGKVDDIKNADEGSTAAIQKEIGKLMGQANELFQQAQARITQLQKG